MASLFAGNGSSGTDRNAQLQGWGDLSSIYQFAGPTGAALTNQGAGTQQQSIDFFSSLLSGNPALTAQVLAPTNSAIQQQAGQQLQTLNQFGNRSGGTNAAAQQVSSNAQSQQLSALDTLLGTAGAELGTLGGQRLSAGIGLENLAEGSAGTLSGQAGSTRTGDQALATQQAQQVIDAIGTLTSGL